MISFTPYWISGMKEYIAKTLFEAAKRKAATLGISVLKCLMTKMFNDHQDHTKIWITECNTKLRT